MAREEDLSTTISFYIDLDDINTKLVYWMHVKLMQVWKSYEVLNDPLKSEVIDGIEILDHACIIVVENTRYTKNHTIITSKLLSINIKCVRFESNYR